MTSLSTPFGTLSIGATAKGITFIDWQDAKTQDNAHSQKAKQQLQEYFAGTRTTFDLPLDLAGTPFQLKVWAEIAKIPFGETRSYAQIAAAVGSHPRPVGGATGKNPLPIIIPCHRVMGANGALTGFSAEGGIATKKKFLQFEGIM